MTTQNQTELGFLCKETLSLRAIDQAWVKNRAIELAQLAELDQPNVQGALIEAVEELYERLGANSKDDVPAMLYAPENDTDPYLVAITLDQRAGKDKREPRVHIPAIANVPDVKHTTPREDFENLLFETDFFDANTLETDKDGKYVTAWVQQRWLGFHMYHRKLTIAGSDKHKNKYNRTLGRYVVSKVAVNGSALFNPSPFRHLTKASALEEANRLSAEFSSPFALFRCLDIISNNEEK